MFKKPIKADITITHELKEEDRNFIDQKIDQVQAIIKETLIILAIGIPTVILFGLGANAAIDHFTQDTHAQQ